MNYITVITIAIALINQANPGKASFWGASPFAIDVATIKTETTNSNIRQLDNITILQSNDGPDLMIKLRPNELITTLIEPPKPGKANIGDFPMTEKELEPEVCGTEYDSSEELSENHRLRLQDLDFRDVNDINQDGNATSGSCWACIVAALNDQTISQMTKDYKIPDGQIQEPANVSEVIKLFHEVGFTKTRVVVNGSTWSDVKETIASRLGNGELATFVLILDRDKRGVKVLLSRVWRDYDGLVYELHTDFAMSSHRDTRFKTSLPEPSRVASVIQPIREKTEAMSNIEYELEELNVKERCRGKRIIGYLASWSKNEFTERQANMMTNIVFAFAEMKSNGSLRMPKSTLTSKRISEMFSVRKSLAKKGTDLKISVAIGGWSNSEHFSKVVANSASRDAFVERIKRFVDKHKFDGVDIDWEYPGTGGATEGTKEDKRNYVTFLAELRRVLGQQKLISIAAAVGIEAKAGFDINGIAKHVDWIGVMTYDYFGAWSGETGKFVGPNAPLYHASPQGYSGKLNTNWGIKQYACQSNQLSKIILGVPFYGRYWSKTVDGVNPKEYPLFRKAVKPEGTGKPFGGEESFRLIDSKMLKPEFGLEQRWDDKSKTPWAIHKETKMVLTYDDARSIDAKVTYAIENNLGGMMIWSLDQDTDGLTLTRRVKQFCKRSSSGRSGSVDKYFKCSPVGNEIRWWTWSENKENAGMCGKSAPLYKGFYAHCDPEDPGYSCCSDKGYCGSGPNFCSCKGCVDYGKNPEKLVAEPLKPSRKVTWHVGFDVIKPGQPRCGPNVAKVNGKKATCNPDDDQAHCCSPIGYCGSGDDFCKCRGCKDYKNIVRKLSVSSSIGENSEDSDFDSGQEESFD